MLLYFKFLYSLSIDKVLFSFLYFILENDKINKYKKLLMKQDRIYHSIARIRWWKYLYEISIGHFWDLLTKDVPGVNGKESVSWSKVAPRQNRPYSFFHMG